MIRADGSVLSSTIDYALVQASLIPLGAVQEFTIVQDANMMSDHRPIALSLSLAARALPPRVAPPAQTRWRRQYDSARLEACSAQELVRWTRLRARLMRSQADGSTRLSDEQVISSLASAFTTAINNSLHRAVGSYTVRARPHGISFYSPESDRVVARCTASGDLVRAAERAGGAALAAERRTSHHELMQCRKRMARTKLAEARALGLRRVMEAAKDPRLFWPAVRALHPSAAAAATALPASVLVRGEIVSDPAHVLECWRAAFEEISNVKPRAGPPPPPEGGGDDAAAQAFAQHVGSCVRTPLSALPERDRPAPTAALTALEREVTREEVEGAVEGMRRNCAPGPDGVPAFWFKDGGDAVVDALTLLLNDVMARGIWPAAWGYGVIVPLFKKGQRANPSDYRGITLLPR